VAAYIRSLLVYVCCTIRQSTDYIKMHGTNVQIYIWFLVVSHKNSVPVDH
jgi:hypothetical protein